MAYRDGDMEEFNSSKIKECRPPPSKHSNTHTRRFFKRRKRKTEEKRQHEELWCSGSNRGQKKRTVSACLTNRPWVSSPLLLRPNLTTDEKHPGQHSSPGYNPATLPYMTSTPRHLAHLGEVCLASLCWRLQVQIGECPYSHPEQLGSCFLDIFIPLNNLPLFCVERGLVKCRCTFSALHNRKDSLFFASA